MSQPKPAQFNTSNTAIGGNVTNINGSVRIEGDDPGSEHGECSPCVAHSPRHAPIEWPANTHSKINSSAMTMDSATRIDMASVLRTLIPNQMESYMKTAHPRRKNQMSLICPHGSTRRAITAKHLRYPSPTAEWDLQAGTS